MQLIVNGKSQELAAAVGAPTVARLLRERGIEPGRIAVAVNGRIVPREAWGEHPLAEGDEVEIVHLVGGGSPDEDLLVIAGRSFRSRLFTGTGKWSDPRVMVEALERSGTEMVTAAIRYLNLEEKGRGSDLEHLDLSRYHLLPNTAGATTAEQAVRMAQLARAATGTNWVKLEVIGDSRTLWPDVAATVEATRILVKEDFVVLPYTSPDLVAALRLEEAGAATVMPLASLIGSGQGFIDWHSIRRIIERCSVPVVVDAGLGSPSDAALAMELGADAVLVNTAIARAKDPVTMAEAMKLAVRAGRLGYRAGRIPRRDEAEPSSPPAGVVKARSEA